MLRAHGVELGHRSTVDVEELARMREDGRTQAQCAAHFHDSQQTISSLLKRHGLR